jgi:kinesin family protein 1
LIAELNETWEEKLRKTEEIQKERESSLAEMGIAMSHGEDGTTVGLFTPKNSPHLVNLNEDPFMSECLLYYIKNGITKVGQVGDIQLSGEFILDHHCLFINTDGIVSIEPCEKSMTFVNGELIRTSQELVTGSRIILGNNHVFRFTDPRQGRTRRPTKVDNAAPEILITSEMCNYSSQPATPSRPSSPSFGGGGLLVDWGYAQDELFQNTGYDIRKEIEEKERQFELKEKLFETRINDLEKERAQTAVQLAQATEEKAHIEEMLMHQKEEFEKKLKDVTDNQKKAEIEIEQKIMEKFNSEMQTKLQAKELELENQRKNKEKAKAEIEEQLMQKYQVQLQAELEAKVHEVETQKRKEVDDLMSEAKEKAHVQAKIEAEELFQQERRAYEMKIMEMEELIESKRAENSQQISLNEEPQMIPLQQNQMQTAKDVLYKWKRYKYTSLKDDIKYNTPLLQEANVISAELKKNVSFQFVMLSDTSYTPLPLAVATGTDIDVEFDDDSKDLFFSYDQLPGSVVAVEVKDGKHGTTHIWSLNKLKQRLMSMRGMYNQQDDDISDQSTDPFYDHTPWFKSIGHSHIFISNLLIPEILVRKVAIVGSRGDVKGHLTISIRYLAEEELDEKSISECVTLNFDKSVPRKSIISVSSDPVYMVVRPSLEEKAKSIFSSTDLLDCSVELAEETSEQVNEGQAVNVQEQDDTAMSPDDQSGSLKYKSCNVPILNGEFINSLVPNNECLRNGKKFYFRVIVMQATGIPREYTDVFVQYRILLGTDKMFTTPSLHNDHTELALGFFQVQNFCVIVNDHFLHYIKHCPIVLEVFGHYQKYPMYKEIFHPPILENKNDQSSSSSYRYCPLPVRSLKSPLFDTSGSMHSFVEVDILAHIELLELSQSGQYLPVPVDHSNSNSPPCFLLSQGIQRRIRLSLIYESGSELYWDKVNDIAIGHVRSVIDGGMEVENSSKILSLTPFMPNIVGPNSDNMLCYNIEVAWDSSLHENELLNRITPSGETVYVTLSAYIEFDNSSQPACFTSDLPVKIHRRDSKPSASRSFFSFFTRHKPNPDFYKCVSIFDLSLRKTRDKTPDLHDNVLVNDVSSHGKRIRRNSLIEEHQDLLSKLSMIEDSEKSRHILDLQQRLVDLHKLQDTTNLSLTEEAKQHLLERCIYYLLNKQEDDSIDQLFIDDDRQSVASSSYTVLSRKSNKSSCPVPMCIPIIQDKTYTKSNSYTKKGYLLFLNEQERQWIRRYVVIKRPYVCIYNSESDPVERCLINLSRVRIDCPDSMRSNNNSFTISTKYRVIIIQTIEGDTALQWINALDPLLVGAMKSQANTKKK